ncbi:MAG: GspH/FimT family pseudopilin [Zoogloeaceae bacterium]|nr:GspH/FimT family pseudopilin [Zoogloeaceae bacterium]
MITLRSGRVRLGTIRTSAGFTLIELVVALSIAAFAVALVPFAAEKFFAGSEYRSTVRDLITSMRSARMMAMKTGRETVFRLDTASGTFAVGSNVAGRVPNSIEVELRVAQGEIDANGVGAIRFYPDGSSTGGSVILRREGGGLQLRVGWLLGRLSQHPV